MKGKICKQRWLCPLVSCPFSWACGPADGLGGSRGWSSAWAIQGLMPVKMATTILRLGMQATFFMFLGVFTLLLIAEIKIMIKQISIGPEGL